MITLVPNNTERVDLSVFSPDTQAHATAVAGVTLIVRVAASSTATGALHASLNYTATAYASLAVAPPHYYVDILGVDIAAAVTAGAAVYDTAYVLQVIEGTTVTAYTNVYVRRTRKL